MKIARTLFLRCLTLLIVIALAVCTRGRAEARSSESVSAPGGTLAWDYHRTQLYRLRSH